MGLSLDNSCFLCLQKSPPDVKKEEENNLGDKCDGDEKKEDHLLFERVSLRLINSYLQLNGGGEGQVWMCLECRKVTCRLSVLCAQLMELQIKTNLSLHHFNRKLEQGNSHTQSLLGKEEDVENGDLQLQRNQTILKCKMKLDRVRRPVIQLARVELPKIEVVDEEEGEDEEPQCEQFSVTILKSQPIEQEDEEEEQQLKVEDDRDEYIDWVESSMSPPSPPSEPSSPPPPPRRRHKPCPLSKSKSFPCQTCGLRFASKWERRQHAHIHRLPRTLKKKGSVASVSCPLCPEPKPTFYGSKELERHEHIFHLAHIFASSRLEKIPSSLFEEYCKHVIHIEGLLSRKGPASYSCQQCGRSFTTWKKLHPHLLYDHKETLAQKVEQLQRTTPPNELKKVTLPPVRDDRKCKDCGATFSQAHSLQRHRRESCPLRKDKSVSTAKPCKCSECGTTFPYTATFYRHRRTKHPSSNKPPLFLPP